MGEKQNKNQIGRPTLPLLLLQSLSSRPFQFQRPATDQAPHPAIPPQPPAMEELEEEAAPVSRSHHSTWLDSAMCRFTRLLADGPTKPSRPPQPSTAPPPPTPPTTTLMEELEEEILLRFPPHEPALLFRASLVCKRWCRLISGPRFRRRYRELHRTPPVLGFLCSIADDPDDATAGFIATATFCSPDADLGDCSPLDARHGRVLLQRPASSESEDVLMVWDPIADTALELPVPDLRRYTNCWTAAVLCAATATGTCDHLDCHRGPFLVVYAGFGGNWEVIICTYSSDAGTWSEPITTELQLLPDILLTPSVLVEKALYFGFPIRKTLLKYDMESHETSVIRLPHALYLWRHLVLDGGLALATVQESKLCIWRMNGPEVGAGWTQDRIIELEMLLPDDDVLSTVSNVVGFADGIGVIFLRVGSTLYTIDPKTYEVKNVCNKNIYSAIPYMSFCTPALGAACTEEGSSLCASGARNN